MWRRIARRAELWFEKSGFSQESCRAPAASAQPGAARDRVLRRMRATAGRRSGQAPVRLDSGARDGRFVEGANTTMRVKTFLIALAAAAMAPAAAMAGLGQPSPWQITFQQAASPIMENIHWFHDFLLVVITLITLFVLALLLIVIFKFN